MSTRSEVPVATLSWEEWERRKRRQCRYFLLEKTAPGVITEIFYTVAGCQCGFEISHGVLKILLQKLGVELNGRVPNLCILHPSLAPVDKIVLAFVISFITYPKSEAYVGVDPSLITF